MILVIDEREAALREDFANIDLDPNEVDRLLSRAHSGTEHSVIIRIQQDGVFANDPGVPVTILRVKSEAEVSMEKARRDSAALQATKPAVDREQAARDALAKFAAVWEQPNNSGTVDLTK